MNRHATQVLSPELPVLGAGTFELDSQLSDTEVGARVRVRAMEPEDLELERVFVAGLSPQTGYRRLMSARTPSSAEPQRWTRIDRSREGALIATVSDGDRERQIGVARYALEGDDGEADFAIVVGDAWHGMGLGQQLLGALIVLARQSGVCRLVGTTLPENTALLALGRRLGFRLSRQAGAAFVTTLSLSLRPGAEIGAWDPSKGASS